MEYPLVILFYGGKGREAWRIGLRLLRLLTFALRKSNGALTQT